MVERSESSTRLKGDVCTGSEQAVRIQHIVNAHIWDELGDYDLRPRMAAAVAAPVPVIHGKVDNIPVESSRAWAAALPNARLLLVNGSGHVPHVEQPETYFRAVKTLLSRRWPTAARKVEPAAR